MAFNFQSQFLSKLKEKDDKNASPRSKQVPITNFIFKAALGDNNPIIDESQKVGERMNTNNSQKGNTSINYSSINANDSKMGLIKQSQTGKNNIFEHLNKNVQANTGELTTNLGKLQQLNLKKEKGFSSSENVSSADSFEEASGGVTAKALNINGNISKSMSKGVSKHSSINNSSFKSKKSEGPLIKDKEREAMNSAVNNISPNKLIFNFEKKRTYQEDEKISASVSSSSINILNKSNMNKSVNQSNRGIDYEIDSDKENNINEENLGSARGLVTDFRKLTKREKICDSDTEDEGSDNEKEVSWIIMPDNSFKRFFDVIVALIIIYSAIVLPYNIAFEDTESNSEEIIDNVFNAILFVDIIINFFSAYVDNEDNIVKNRKRIVKTYLKTWFIIDLLSVLPINYFFQQTTAKYNALLRLSRIPKLYRLIRLTKLFRMIKILKKGNVNRVTKFFLEKLKVNANIERLIYFILAFLLLNHISACTWYFCAKLQDLDPDCWVMRLGYIDASNAEIYIVSFYWTLTTVTTVGYGDINAGTTIERIYNLFIMSFGVLMYSFAIGSLSSIVSTLDAKTAEMNQKLQILSSIKKEFSLDQEIYDKVRKVIKYDLSRNQKDKMNFLQELPNKLRIELSQIMHDSVIQKMYFFKDQPSDFIAYVAPLLKPVKFSQNDFLYKISDMIDEMYFVSKGTVSFCLSKEYMEKEIKEIKKHNNFGEIEMCLNEKLTFNIKVKSRNCELFVLKKNDFLRLSVNFKEFIEKFLQRSLMIYLRFNDEKKKVMKSIEDQNKNLQTANKNPKGKTDILEIVDEEGNEEGSEVYDIFADHSDSVDQSHSHTPTDTDNSGHSLSSDDDKNEGDNNREENGSPARSSLQVGVKGDFNGDEDNERDRENMSYANNGEVIQLINMKNNNPSNGNRNSNMFETNNIGGGNNANLINLFSGSNNLGGSHNLADNNMGKKINLYLILFR